MENMWADTFILPWTMKGLRKDGTYDIYKLH